MKILMAAMSMGLGGAETHILELSRELVRRGHIVFVASNGGEYVPELEKLGVKHIALPLGSKRPDAIISSYRGLSRLIREERFDIVHAHARIPAFICGKLKKKFGFAFFTTAHGDFKVNALLSRITDWGDHVFSVSEDIAANIVKNYNYPAKNISIVQNGIDVSRFSPDTDGSMIREKLGLTGKKVVMYLGRLDADSALTARVLCLAAEKIYRAFSDARIVIVGGGKEFTHIYNMAKTVNERAKTDIVIMAGATSDAAHYIAACDVFTGPSRSAMEALSSGKPTVLCGAFGMLGAFSAENAEEAKRTNLCCRGSALPDAERMAEEVISLLSLSDGERNTLSGLGRSFIKENYSVGVMTAAYEKGYYSLLDKKKKSVVICGYYGYGNAGDEAMLASLIHSLSENKNISRIYVMSATPKATSEKYGVLSVHRFDYRAVCNALSSADVMIFGGGNILQDKTSTKSLVYYAEIIRLARVHACRVAICANGIGPVTKKENLKRLKRSLMLSDYISLRDEASYELARELTGRDDIILTSDIVCASDIDIQKYNNKKSAYYLVFPKKLKGLSSKTVSEFCGGIYRKYGLSPVFIPMHKGEDTAFCHELLSQVPFGKVALWEQMNELFSECEFSVCMRLHGVIFSLMAKCPMIGISDDGKMPSFMSSFGIAECAFFPPDVSSSDICVAADKIIANKADIRDSLGYEAAKHKERAREELHRLNEYI
ncbi:MAG: polysaccharide pyruvyl transferase CsaB [Eubacteriales bacterium]